MDKKGQILNLIKLGSVSLEKKGGVSSLSPPLIPTSAQL